MAKPFTSLTVSTVRSHAAKGVERDDGLASLKLRLLEFGAAIRELHAVVLGQRPAREALATSRLFFGWMSLASPMSMMTAWPPFFMAFHASSSGSRAVRPNRCRPAQGAPAIEVGELHPVEGEIALLPLVAPVLDHEREKVAYS
jgi:hypothetical protein